MQETADKAIERIHFLGARRHHAFQTARREVFATAHPSSTPSSCFSVEVRAYRPSLELDAASDSGRMSGRQAVSWAASADRLLQPCGGTLRWFGRRSENQRLDKSLVCERKPIEDDPPKASSSLVLFVHAVDYRDDVHDAPSAISRRLPRFRIVAVGFHATIIAGTHYSLAEGNEVKGGCLESWRERLFRARRPLTPQLGRGDAMGTSREEHL